MATWEYKPYQESEDVLKKRQQYESYQQNKPADYSSQYQTQITNLQNQIANRPSFSYDINGDALYQQMAQRYMQQGKQAMQDTIGQAAGLTGGYGSSYGQAVGQQQYNAYLQGIADNLPDYYNMALNAYNQEGSDMYNKLSMYQTAENQDYSRWQDQYNIYNTELNRLENAYNTERSWDRNLYDTDNSFNRSVYETDRNFEYTKQQNDMALAQSQVNWYLSNGMTPPDDLLAASGYSAQYVNDYVQKYLQNAAAAGSGGGGGKNASKAASSVYGAAKSAQKASGLSGNRSGTGGTKDNPDRIKTDTSGSGSGSNSGNSTWLKLLQGGK